MTTEQTVCGADGVEIATTDWGGGDVPLLLTHGAFFARNTLEGLVPHLLPTFRVVTFDMRNHGASAEGPWEWDLVAADVDAVRRTYEIDQPVVAGHSLGGMVAAVYAAAHPGHVRAAVNIDGHGRGKPENYLDMTEDAVHAAWATMEAGEQALLAQLDKPRFVEMLDMIKELDMFDLWRSVPCPLLVFNCVAPDPAYDAHGGQEMFRAYRDGLRRDFAALAAAHPTIEVATVDKTHMTVVFDPEETARLMADFVARS